MKLEKLKTPRGGHCADQCRYMGISVGDTIIGRETYSTGVWSEAKLTVIFIGKQECVFESMSRNTNKPQWRSNGESANWSLCHRDWYKIE
jgi:hypothetical protein